jgi:hypothetical protein
MADPTQAVDEEAPAQDAQTTETETTETTETTEAHNVEGLPVWAKDLLKELRSENAKHRKAKTEAEKAQAEAERKAAEQQGKYQELYETERAKAAQLEADIQEAQLSATRSQVGLKHGLGAVFTALLRGDTEDEMERHAKELIEAMPKKSAAADASAGSGSRGSGIKSVEEVKKTKPSREYNVL